MHVPKVNNDGNPRQEKKKIGGTNRGKRKNKGDQKPRRGREEKGTKTVEYSSKILRKVILITRSWRRGAWAHYSILINTIGALLLYLCFYLFCFSAFQLELDPNHITEPEPSNPVRRSYWVLRLVRSTILHGGYLTPKLFAPKDVWTQVWFGQTRENLPLSSSSSLLLSRL